MTQIDVTSDLAKGLQFFRAGQSNATPYDQSIIAETAKSLRPNKWFGKKPKQNKPEPS